MKLMSMKQYGKMTKASLVRKIMKALKKLPKMKLAKICYELEKKRLPTISTTKEGMPRLTGIPRLTASQKAYMGKKKGTQYLKHYLRDSGQRYTKPRSAKQRANDERLGRMAKARAKVKRKRRRR